MIINFEHQMEQILTHHSSQIQCGEKCMSDVCKHVLTFMTNAFCLFYTVPYTLNKNATIFCGCPF